MTPAKLWDRLPRESTKAFAAFSEYLSLGSDRSTAKVAQGLGKSKALIDGWSSRHRWVVRAAAWDAELERAKRQAELETAREMGRRHAALAVALQAKVIERLQTIDINTMNWATLARVFEVSVRVERLARGMTTESTRLYVAPPPPIVDLMEPDDQLMEYDRMARILEVLEDAGLIPAVIDRDASGLLRQAV